MMPFTSKHVGLLLIVVAACLCVLSLFDPSRITHGVDLHRRNLETSPNNQLRSDGDHHGRLQGTVHLKSPHECKNSPSQAVKDECSRQKSKRRTYSPDNSTIYHVYKFVKDADIKYFHESATDGHRDKRYPRPGKKSSQPIGSRSDVLREIFKQWTAFCNERSLVSWIAHGLLIGWYWNNDLLPWDYDLDVQVTAHDLLGAFSKYHNAMYKDRYLFDVNPHKICRLHQFDNVIDARFIDTHTGYYVDVTGLAFNPKKNKLQCKTPHSYDVGAIFPLQSSTFCGQEVWVPNQVEPILAKEYQEKSMTKAMYSVMGGRGKRTNYRFDQKLRKWIS